MLPFDFNIHLPGNLGSDRDLWLANELRHDVPGLQDAYMAAKGALGTKVAGANFMLFNQEIPFQIAGLHNWIVDVRRDHPKAIFTQLLDFRHPGIEQALLRLRESGVQGVKYHSYVQKITKEDIPRAVEVAVVASQLGLFLCIDASYGTAWMYEHDNLLLAANIVKEVRDVPVVILHSGGARCWDAMLLALDAPNVFLETSFSIPYYAGSSIETDLAFIYRKIGSDRVLYGSDYPYVPLNDSLRCMQDFFERHGFGEEDQHNIFELNALRLSSQLEFPTYPESEIKGFQ